MCPELEDTAFLLAGETLYFARQKPATARSPHTAITRLIQGVHALGADQARARLRARIYSTAAATPMDRAMVKIAAKRITDWVEAEDPRLKHEQTVDVSRWDEGLTRLLDTSSLVPPASPLDAMTLAFELARKVPREGPRYLQDRPVAAILVSRKGKILGAALNQNAQNRTLHAEVNLIQGLAATGNPLPAGAALYVTLKCCRMCAAMIWQCASDVSELQVFYGEDDPGRSARATALEPGTPDRLLAARTANEARLALLHPLIES